MPALPAENKKAVVHDVLGDRANPVDRQPARVRDRAGRAREIPKIVEELARRASAERGARAGRGPVARWS